MTDDIASKLQATLDLRNDLKAAPDDELLDAERAGVFLGVGLSRVYNLISEGVLERDETVGRRALFRLGRLRALLERRNARARAR